MSTVNITIQASTSANVTVESNPTVNVQIQAVTGPPGPAGEAGASSDVQVFTSSGTWTKPAGAKVVFVQCIAGGGGGSCGARTNTGIAANGGGGGAAGGFSEATFRADDLPGNVDVTVGAAGEGRAGHAVDNMNPASGTAGGDSSFGDYVLAKGGNAATQQLGGTNSLAAGSAGTGTKSPGGLGGNGGNGTTAAQSPAFPSIFGTVAFSYASSGGGGGGGINNQTPGTPQNGAASGVKAAFHPGTLAQGTAGTVGAGQNGGNGNNSGLVGTGGGGGAANATSAAGNGGHGANYGAGGGGGGATRNGNVSGAGGNGAPGIVIVTTIF